jgi:hypothetical protein
VAHLEKISYQLDRVYNEGATILEEGKFYDSLFILLEGTARFLISGFDVGVVAVSDNGDYFIGASAFILRKRLGFSLIASTRVTIRVLTREMLDKTIIAEPSFGSRLYEYLTYDLIDKVTRVWLVFFSQNKIQDGVKEIKKFQFQKSPNTFFPEKELSMMAVSMYLFPQRQSAKKQNSNPSNRP